MWMQICRTGFIQSKLTRSVCGSGPTTHTAGLPAGWISAEEGISMAGGRVATIIDRGGHVEYRIHRAFAGDLDVRAP